MGHFGILDVIYIAYIICTYYIYIYMGLGMCVCVCIYIYIANSMDWVCFQFGN